MAFDIKKIKNLFVQTSEQTDIQEPSTPSAPIADKPVENKSTSDGAFDQDVFNSLIKAIEDHNLPGEDYLEFLSALQAMQNIPLDDKLKVQTVLATLSTKGLTVQKIKESADYYKKVLNEEQKQFNTELNGQIQEQVKSKEKSIKDLQEQNTLKTQQITKLTQEINENQLKITELQGHLKEADAKINIAVSNFNKTLGYIVSQIDANLNKINN